MHIHKASIDVHCPKFEIQTPFVKKSYELINFRCICTKTNVGIWTACTGEQHLAHTLTIYGCR